MVSNSPQRPIPYRRSAFQVALLLFATFGLYTFFWYFYARRWCSATLEKQDQPLLKSIALIIPIFDLFLLFELGQAINAVAARAKISQSAALPWLGVLSFLIDALWRLPDPYWFLFGLGFVPLALMQLVLFHAELVLEGPAAQPTRLNWVEWLFIVIGGLLWVLAAATAWLPDDTGKATPLPWFPSLVLATSVVLLAIFARASRYDIVALADARERAKAAE